MTGPEKPARWLTETHICRIVLHMNLIELAQRIKARRRALELALEQVASRTGLTRSVLSKVEHRLVNRNKRPVKVLCVFGGRV